MAAPVSAVALAKWQEVQEDMRQLTLQRSMRFVKVMGIGLPAGYHQAEGGQVLAVQFTTPIPRQEARNGRVTRA